jgi:hypothetical protein
MPVDKKLIDQLTDQNTIIVLQDGGLDSQIAERWLKANAPKALEDERVFAELHLLHLLPAQSVCAVFRSPATSAQSFVVNQQGSLIGTNRPDAETFAEMVVTKPIKVGDYWTRANARVPGKPDTAAFLQALQETLIPLRLNYADKCKQEPCILVLGTM